VNKSYLKRIDDKKKEVFVMMYNGMMSGFGFLFMGLYVVGIVCFFYLLASMAKSLAKIASKMDKDA